MTFPTPDDFKPPKRPYRAGGDRGKMEFSMTDEQWERIFGPKEGCRDPDCYPGCRNCYSTPAETTLDGPACPQPGGCASCPDPIHCATVRLSVGLES